MCWISAGLGAYDEAEMHSLADAAAEYVPSVQVSV